MIFAIKDLQKKRNEIGRTVVYHVQ